MGYNERDYQREKARTRIAKARELLGGKCVECGAEENLQFDHINPNTKVAKISVIANWAWDRFLSEVEKCQLLCQDCHTAKTMVDLGRKRSEHGTRNKYRVGCRCDLCKKANTDDCRQRRQQKLQQV
jgi:5-methylcytosine-specific restriction endonuclease McrA